MNANKTCIYCVAPVTQKALDVGKAVKTGRARFAHTGCIDAHLKYPGDLVLRPGRRVCRTNYDLKPIYVGEGEYRSWACGTLREIKGDTAIVETFSLDVEELWELPLSALEVNHSQENMTDEQYLYALEALRDLIADGLKLVKVDSTSIGDKWTYVSWGFHENCNRNLRSHRPEIWPIGMPRRQEHQYCPLDAERGPHRGCFYRCLAFQQADLKGETALFLYDRAIEKARKE